MGRYYVYAAGIVPEETSSRDKAFYIARKLLTGTMVQRVIIEKG